MSSETVPTVRAMAADPGRNRVLIAFGIVFFLIAATLVVVVQNIVRRPNAAIVIPSS